MEHYFCEHCCYLAAKSDNLLPYEWQECLYLWKRIIEVRLEDAALMLIAHVRQNRAPQAKIQANDKSRLARMINDAESMHRQGLLFEELKEWLYVAGQVLAIVGTVLGGLVYAVFALVMILFPSLGGKSPEQVAAEREANERRKRREQARWEAERDYFYEEEDKKDEEAREAREKLWNEKISAHNKDTDKINSINSLKPVIKGKELEEDDQRVKEVNGALKAAERGTESLDNVRKMREELYDSRNELYDKDDKKREQRKSP
jgi:hypothetical protein